MREFVDKLAGLIDKTRLALRETDGGREFARLSGQLKGLRLALDLARRQQDETPRVALRPTQLHFLNSVFDSPAYHKYREGMGVEITWQEACDFWQVDPQMPFAFIDDFMAMVEELRDLVTAHKEVVVKKTGRVINWDDVVLIYNLHHHLLAKFNTNLNACKTRTI